MTLPIEFRIPASPTPPFYNRVRFFCAALRRLGGSYAEAPVKVCVGDHADIGKVRAETPWTARYNVEWHGVPSKIFTDHWYYGTADYRYLLPEPAADLIVLADADVAVVQPILDDFTWMRCEQPCIAGHMAHFPPSFERPGDRQWQGEDLWPSLFRHFSIPWPESLYPYSMDLKGQWAPVPAYYNLGFVVLNRAALRIFSGRIFEAQDKMKALFECFMRCQIAVTLIAHSNGMRIKALPAIFNAANDIGHFQHNGVRVQDIKVIHYLRTEEMNRESFLSYGDRETFLDSPLQNPVNQLLQKVAREIMSGDSW
jgi:hypothetical protein